MITLNSVNLYNQPSFGIYFNKVNGENGKLLYRGDTKICRDDIYFPEVIDFLENKYTSVPKVNVVMHACSDGEEVYSFLGVLHSKLGEKSAKYLPVTAKDIEGEHLNLAQKGIYYVGKSEYDIANDCMNGNFYKYFNLLPYIDDDNAPPQYLIEGKGSKNELYPKRIKVNDLIKKSVKFEQSDILEDVNHIDFKNTVLFARNFWPYLDKKDMHQLAKRLSERMDSSSTLIIGDFDKEEADLGSVLKMYGFQETSAENVYELPKNKSKSKNNNIFMYPMEFLY